MGQKVVFSVDRQDYTKGLINRLHGYELFLKNNPQWHGKVVFIVSVAPSRIGVESYQEMKDELEQTVCEPHCRAPTATCIDDAVDLSIPEYGA